MSPAGIELQIEEERSGLARVLHFEPDTGPIVIGRDEESHVHLAAQSISRKHAVIEKAPDGFVVTDESSLGTQRNGEPLPKETPTLLADGDVLTLPGFQITIRIQGAATNHEDTGGFHDLLAMAKGLDAEDASDDAGGPSTGTIHVVIDGDETAQQTIGGEGSTLLIGRSAECHVRLDDPYRIISGLHAKIERAWAGTFLYDLSRNGVFVNGEPIVDVRDLKDGDRITLAIAEVKAAAPTLVYREAAADAKAAGAGDAGAQGEPLGSFGAGEFDPGEQPASEEHPWAADAEGLPVISGEGASPRPGGASAMASAGGAEQGTPADTAPDESQEGAPAGGDAPSAEDGHDNSTEADSLDHPKERDLFTLIAIGVAAAVIVLFAVIGFLMFKG